MAKTNNQLNKRQDAILELIEKQGQISSAGLAKTLPDFNDFNRLYSAVCRWQQKNRALGGQRYAPGE